MYTRVYVGEEAVDGGGGEGCVPALLVSHAGSAWAYIGIAAAGSHGK